jgi:signal transduction histidine kinase
MNMTLDPSLKEYQTLDAVGWGRLGSPHDGVVDHLQVVGNLLRPFTDHGELIASLDQTLSEVFGEEVMCGLKLWSAADELLQLAPGSFRSPPSLTVSYRVKISGRESTAARVFARRVPFFSNHVFDDPEVPQDFAEAFGIDQLLLVRLDGDQDPVGVLLVANKQSHFTAADVEEIERISPLIGMAVSRAMHVIELHRKARLEAILGRLAVAIGSSASIYSAIRTALEEFCRALEADLATFVPLDGEGWVWHPGELDQSEVEKTLRAAGSHGRARHVLNRPAHVGGRGSAAFHVPVRLRTRQIGHLAILRERAEPFSPAERDAVMRLADLAALAWATDVYQQQRVELARLGERQRIGDDLHDDLAQLLYAIQLSLAEVRGAKHDSAAVEAKVVRTADLMSRAERVLRGSIFEPTSDTGCGFAEQLTEAVAVIEEEFAIIARVSVSTDASKAAETLGKAAREALVRFTRETVTNAAKHVGPCRVGVTARVSRGRILFEVADDGLGMDRRQSAGHGLKACRRAIRKFDGSVRVYSSPGQPGTRVVASLPLAT